TALDGGELFMGRRLRCAVFDAIGNLLQPDVLDPDAELAPQQQFVEHSWVDAWRAAAYQPDDGAAQFADGHGSVGMTDEALGAVVRVWICEDEGVRVAELSQRVRRHVEAAEAVVG